MLTTLFIILDVRSDLHVDGGPEVEEGAGRGGVTLPRRQVQGRVAAEVHLVIIIIIIIVIIIIIIIVTWSMSSPSLVISSQSQPEIPS